MSVRGKMAIVGSDESVLVFQAVGVKAFSAANPAQAKELLRKLKSEYQIIFLTEEFFREADIFPERDAGEVYPIYLSVPSATGSDGAGLEALKRASERALGIDILSRGEQEE